MHARQDSPLAQACVEMTAALHFLPSRDRILRPSGRRGLALPREMPASEDYHEALWEAVPEGLEPVDFARRSDFLLGHVRAGERVLDVGCGEGRFAAELARAGAEVVGIDVAAEPLRRARERHPELDLRQVPAAGAWPLQDASFDAVWAGEVIEHVADTAGWLSELRRVLRSGGRPAAEHARPRAPADARLGARAARVRDPLRPALRPPALLHPRAPSASCSKTSAFKTSPCGAPEGCPARGGSCWRAHDGHAFDARGRAHDAFDGGR